MITTMDEDQLAARDDMPPPQLTFAIGDVHGESELLASAVQAIAAYAGDESWRLVMLGDYVDRGPDSAGVIRLLREMESQGRTICLKGNHEVLMIKACETGDTKQWFKNGGKATLRSYRGTLDSARYGTFGANLKEGSPAESEARDHLAWLKTLPVAFADRHRIFVHGGIKPGATLAGQDEETCLWIRDPFLKAKADELPAHIVHGHTPKWKGKPISRVPERLPHRTNLDTAAYKTGRLSIGVFETDRAGGAIDVIQISRPALSPPPAAD